MSTSTSNVSFSARDFSAGKNIAGCYALDALLFETPFAVVWSAEDDLLGRKVALYFLPDSVVSDEKVLEELRQLVRLNRQVLHPGIVRVYDLVEDVGCAAISMDLVDARPLAELQARQAGGAFSPGETQKWFGQLIRTCAEAHEAQLIHRDLSPDTVLIRADGDLLVSAFGISRTVLDALSRQQPNQPDPHLAYLSPQLLDGEAPARTDDTYSFGALAFALLTGQPPFYKDQILAQIRKTVPPDLAARREELQVKGEDIPAQWEKAVAACLAKHTDTRPKNFKEVGQLMGIEGVAAASAVPAPTSASAHSPAAPAKQEKSPAEPAPKAASEKAMPPPAKGAPSPNKTPTKDRGERGRREKSSPPDVTPPPASSISPFSPRDAAEDVLPERKRGSGIGIAVGLGLFALILIGLIYLASRSTVETGTTTAPENVETAIDTGTAEGTPAPEVPVTTLPTPGPSAVAAATPTASPVAAATATPRSSPAATATPTETAAIDAATLTQAIAKADALFKELTEEQTSLEETVKNKREAATAESEKLPDVESAMQEQEGAVKVEKEAQEKAAAEAEAARKAAEAKEAALKASKKKLDEQQSALKKKHAAIDELKQKMMTAEKQAQTAEASLEEVKSKVAAARAERKRLTDSRTALAAQAAQEKAERELKLAEERKAAAAAAQKSAAEQAALARDAAAAEKAAAEAAALSEQARSALESAETLRQTSEGTPAPGATPSVGADSGATVTNSLGMKFVPVGDVLFSIWPTRMQDYSQFAKATGRADARWKDPGFEQGPDHPVVYVTWLDAIAFCQWLTEKEQASGDLPTNRTYRLPSDLEWSAAVGLPTENGKTPEDRDMGIANVFPWGNSWPPPVNSGNYTGEETGSDVAIKGFKDGFIYTSPVGRFSPSPTGLYDLGGNVWEWCMDWWNSKQTSKVLRGASWYNGALKLSLLSSCRVRATPDSSTDNYGFRVVLSAIPKATALP